MSIKGHVINIQMTGTFLFITVMISRLYQIEVLFLR